MFRPDDDSDDVSLVSRSTRCVPACDVSFDKEFVFVCRYERSQGRVDINKVCSKSVLGFMCAVAMWIQLVVVLVAGESVTTRQRQSHACEGVAMWMRGSSHDCPTIEECVCSVADVTHMRTATTTSATSLWSNNPMGYGFNLSLQWGGPHF